MIFFLPEKQAYFFIKKISEKSVNNLKVSLISLCVIFTKNCFMKTLFDKQPN